MAKRTFDLVVATAGLVLLGPSMLFAAWAVRASDHGPALYRARRIGLNGRPFVMYKFRTMRLTDGGPVITSPSDKRVFPFGNWLRRLKFDELPQLYNILRGEMSVVGPRPEDPAIVERHYRPQDWETLRVRPGLVSPGTLFEYTRGDTLIARDDVVRTYAQHLLPLKMNLELVYMRRRSFRYDLELIARTLAALVAKAGGRAAFADPPEMTEARLLMDDLSAETAT